MNIYGEDNADTGDILTGKVWLEKPKKSRPTPKNPAQISLEELPELLMPSMPSPNYLTKIKHLEKKLSQIHLK